MKSRLFIMIFALCLVGCEDFLEEKSQSEIRPSTVADMEKILLGEAYFSLSEGGIFNRVTDIFTDDVECNQMDNASLKIKKEKQRYRFTWDANMFNEGGGGEDVTLWSVPYRRIMGCNVVLEYINDMKGDEKKREYLRGEAYALRGFYYYMLVNFFGLPYTYGNPAQNPGVPLKLVTGVTDERFKRNTVAECYAQIKKDLLKGAELLEANKEKESRDLKRLTYSSTYALLSRACLHMGDWDEVIKYSDMVLGNKSELLDMKNNMYEGAVYGEYSATEILWVCQEDPGYPTPLAERQPFTPSTDLIDLYQRDVDNLVMDIRADHVNSHRTQVAYLKESSWGYGWMAGVMKGYFNSEWGCGGIRTAEIYLNRAEAYIRQYMESGDTEKGKLALVDLNRLRSHRFAAGYIEKQIGEFSSAEDLLDFCLRERRRELCSEANHRWFDLRRLGMPEIKHIYIDDDNGHKTEFVLLEKDKRYILPISDNVLDRNPNLRSE